VVGIKDHGIGYDLGNCSRYRKAIGGRKYCVLFRRCGFDPIKKVFFSLTPQHPALLHFVMNTRINRSVARLVRVLKKYSAPSPPPKIITVGPIFATVLFHPSPCLKHVIKLSPLSSLSEPIRSI